MQTITTQRHQTIQTTIAKHNNNNNNNSQKLEMKEKSGKKKCVYEKDLVV